MPTLTSREMGGLLEPFLPAPSAPLLDQLGLYLDLLLKWNARMNLTAIRDPREIVVRHFGESLFAGQHVGVSRSLLDFGSGAGFPGIPIALLRPEMGVTLAESQQKKASFLQEAVRVLGLTAEVWPSRVEQMPASRTFDCVTLRAVDSMEDALSVARHRATRYLILLTTVGAPEIEAASREFPSSTFIPIPQSGTRIIAKFSRE